MTEVKALERELDRVAALLETEPDPTPIRVERVSGWSVAEQIDHLLKVALAQTARLAERRPAPKGINLAGMVVLGLGRIPRGIGKSPLPVRGEIKSRDDLREMLAIARQRLATLASDETLCRDPRPLAGHPYFGGLTPRRVFRFLAIHTDHHLRIVADIRRAAG